MHASVVLFQLYSFEITIHYSIELADKVSLVISMGLDLNSKNQPSSQ